jgi:hypothetical protein
LFGRSAIAETDGSSWTFARSGFWRRRIEATDETGGVAGEFEPRTLRRGGSLRWSGHELRLEPASMWRERYALADGDRELALLDGKGWGKRPVRVTVVDAEPIDPALLLFATFIVRGLAEDASSAGAGGAASVG